MNVLFLSELFYPHKGGAELATYLYSQLLSKAEFNLVMVTNRFSGEPEVSKNNNLTIYRLPLLKGRRSIKYSLMQSSDVLFSGFLKKLVRWADVVYIPGSWYLAIPIAKALGKPVVTHLHDYLPVCPLATLYDLSERSVCHHHSQILCSPRCIVAYERSNEENPKEVLMSALLNSTVGNYLGKLVALSDSIICVSEEQRRLIIEHMPSMGNKSYVVYNPMPVVPQFSDEGSDFGYLGGPSVFKGFDILCRALQKVHPKTKTHATKMSNLSENMRYSLKESGIIAHEKLDKESYKDLYKRIQVVIVPSVWPEPLPYVVGEALLSKRLVIASRVGGIPEQVKGSEGAFLFEPESYEQLAELIQFVEDLDKESRLDLGSKNRRSFLRKFNNEKASREFIKVLTECC
jgi:glycosyltransferase involved in cell wall biosynthesis